MAAAARAAHLEVDRPPFIFEDTLARRLLGDAGTEPIAYQRQSGDHPVLLGTRLAVTARARYAEDRLAEAVARGVDQYVIVGSGLDTFAYRSRLAERVTVYEVDEPETLRWKRELVEQAELAPVGVDRFVAGDLGAANLTELLVDAGLDTARPAFVSWLGVSMYLDRSAIARMLGAIGTLASGTEVVFDHVLPPAERDSRGAEYASFAEAVGAANGEPWLTALGADEARVMVLEAGLTVVAQPLLAEWLDPLIWQRDDALVPSCLWVMTRARVP